MGSTTHTTAGQQRLAGVARPGVASRYRATSPLAADPAALAVGANGRFAWTVDAIALPTATSMEFDGKHATTRHPSELSP